MRTRAWALVLAGALLAGCGEKREPSSSPSATPRAPVRDDRGELRDLLDRRAAALADGDAAAYAATATGAQRGRDRSDARRARGLGLRAVTFAVGAPKVGQRHARLPLSIGYSLRALPGRYAARRTATAVRTRSGWRISRLSGSRQRPPWEVAAFTRTRSRHFVVLSPPGVDAEADGLSGALEDAYGQMGSVLSGDALRRRYLVQVALDGAQARALTASIGGLGTLSAITDTEVQEEGDAQRVKEILSQRLVVVWSNFVQADFESRRTVLSHELTHAALAGQTSGRVPSWLAEGVALYVSGDDRVQEAAGLVAGGAQAASSRRALSLTGLTEADAIGRLGGDAQASAYAYSSAAAHYIAERFGRRKLLALYDAYNREDLVGSEGDPDLTDQAVREVLRVGLPRLERDLRRWILTGVLR